MTARHTKRFTRILSIDGGGIRGIIPGQILVILEEKLKAKTRNANARIADYFDLIAGTNTGGLMACAYLLPSDEKPGPVLRPKFDAVQVVNLFLEREGDIFSVPFGRKLLTMSGVLEEAHPVAHLYSIAHLEKILDEFFGNAKLSELLKPCLIPAYDIKRRIAHFFTQHDAIKKRGWEYLVKDVARAAMALPVYFECSDTYSVSEVRYPLIDGGVFVNNPALCALAEIHNEYKTAFTDVVILSLGTGYSKKEYDYDSAKEWTVNHWVKPLIDIAMSANSEVVDFQLRQLFDSIGAPGQYLRLNTELPGDVSSGIDDVNPKNLMALKELGTYTAQNFDARLDAFIELLV